MKITSSLLFVFLFSTLSISSLLYRQVSSQIVANADHDRELRILLKLRNDWRIPLLNSYWDSSNGPHCNWKGITCNDGLVTGILLSLTNISHKIPPSICDLNNLIKIDLSDNDIPGEFPTSLYNCSKLQNLDLSRNYFVGQIPSDIDRMSTLRIINLAENNFAGHIPPSIGRLPVLETLLLNNNLLNGTFPPEIGNLSDLKQLNLAYNNFIPSRIPVEFGRLKKMLCLWMTGSNLIGEIPENINNLVNLKHLDFALNGLNGKIPSSLFLLKNLTSLNLGSNRLSGEIPRKIETLNLIDIDLSENILTGTIPEDFGKLQNLRNFIMYFNRLNGKIPSNLFLLKNLTSLNLGGNRLSGEIPRKIETLNLISIDLSKNILTGTIPEDFGKLQNLHIFLMYSNRLNGKIPASIGRIPTLINIQLYNNNLTGVLPPELGLHSKLEEVDFSENQLTGELPEKLCAGGMLVGFTAFSNNLSGELLSSLGNCHSLIDLEISNNRFSGAIPFQIAGLPNLTSFKASNNLLSGEIPFGLTARSRLYTLSLDGNRLSGRIPSTIIPWDSLYTLNLSRNQLSGELPPEIGLLPYLRVLDLSENQISGQIPSGISYLSLDFLNLSSNRLIGKIPVEFEEQTYARSFLNNSGLCTGNLNSNHEACMFESRDSHKLSSGLLTMVLIISGAILLVVLVFILFMIRHSHGKKHKQDLPIWKLTLFQMLDFTESDILSSLTEDNVIGSGGSGKVYRVKTNSTSNNYVAVKKIRSQGKLDQELEKQFHSEVQILGTIRHSSIVKLLCSISSDNSKLLVYEYMENGSLDQLLHNRKREPLDSIHRRVLDWPRRFEIAIGAARGLCYIHHNCSPPIIHRDVKSSNILLDSEFKARIADFGLAKMVVNHGDCKTASVVAGSFGYIAPEYARTTKINEKIDVYSFGVVLLELATGRKANHGDEYTCLAEWAWRQHQEGNNVDDALDEDVKKPCYLDEMRMVFKLGLICTSSLPSDRPSMKQTLQILKQHNPIIGAYKEEEDEEELASQSDVINDDTEMELTLLNNV